MPEDMKKNWFFGLTSRFVMSVMAGLLILSYASVVVNPAKLWFISLAGLFYIPLSIINLIFFLWAVKRKSKSFVIPLLALLPSLFFIGRYVQMPRQNEDSTHLVAKEESKDTIKVITYNVGRFSLHGMKSGIQDMHECADSIFEIIRSQDADIICLQEFRLDDTRKVKTYLSRKLKGYNIQYYIFPDGSGAFGNVTLSRLPVTGKGKIRFEESANLAIYTDHRIGERRFRVYNCHFESYNISFTGMVRALFNADGKVFEETGNKVKRSMTRRPVQVDQVFRDIEYCPVESFVCGDFNDNPMSYTYYRMTRNREDAFVEAGEGFGATYAFLWPVLRIDYVLYPDRYKAVSHEIIRKPYSDHYPVVTRIVL